jgi:N-acetylmuramoyl-L-alanine amidase
MRRGRVTTIFLLAAAGTLVATAASARTAATSAVKKAPVVVIDPGHDRYANSALEPIGPGSKTMKVKDGGGASGVVTGTPEAVVNLAIAKKLAKMLRRGGVRVVMTRKTTRHVSMGNIARAKIANRHHAAAFVRIHCDGSSSSSYGGTHVLYPAYRKGWTSDIYRPSKRLARLVQREVVRSLHFPNRGLDPRSDITGFNWSNVPVILPELGFLSNPHEDRVLNSRSGRKKAAVGLCRGIMRFLGRSPAVCA